MSTTLQESSLVCRSDIVFCDAGDDVVLSCHFQPAISAASMEIKWQYRDKLICHYKDGEVTESSGYEGRVSLSLQDLHNGDVSLTLIDVRPQHRGVYVCEVIYKQQTFKEYIFLHVRTEKFTLVASQTISAELGEDVILAVFFSPETSAMSMEIKWLRGTELIYLYKYGQETVYDNRLDLSSQHLERGNVSLTLRNVQQSDLGDYTCMIFYDGRQKTTNLHLGVGVSAFGSTNSMERNSPLMRDGSLLQRKNSCTFNNPKARSATSSEDVFLHMVDESSLEKRREFSSFHSLQVLCRKSRSSERSVEQTFTYLRDSFSSLKEDKTKHVHKSYNFDLRDIGKRKNKSKAKSHSTSDIDYFATEKEESAHAIQVPLRRTTSQSVTSIRAAAAAEAQTQDKARAKMSRSARKRSQKRCQFM